MAYIKSLLLLAAFAGVALAQGSEYCTDPNTLPNCVNEMKQLQNMKLPYDRASVDADCSVLKKGMNCIDQFVKTCLEGAAKTETDKKMSGIRTVMRKLCDDPELKEELLKHDGCYKKVSPGFEGCSRKFAEQAVQSPAAMCPARETFIHCARDVGKENCSPEATKSVCQMARTLANMLVSEDSCNGDSYSICRAGAPPLSPMLALLLAAVLLAFKSY